MEFVDLHSGKSKFVPRTLPEKVWNNLLRKRYKKFNNTFENRILKSYRVKLGHAIKLCDQVKREREREREREMLKNLCSNVELFKNGTLK